MSEELLSPNKEMAAKMIAIGGKTAEEIAEIAGVSRATIFNWKKDEHFINRVDSLRREFKDFGNDLILSNYVKAIEGYWELINTSENDMVRKQGYEYFINRILGKPTSKLDIEAGLKDNNNIDKDVLDQELEEWENEED